MLKENFFTACFLLSLNFSTSSRFFASISIFNNSSLIFICITCVSFKILLIILLFVTKSSMEESDASSAVILEIIAPLVALSTIIDSLTFSTSSSLNSSPWKNLASNFLISSGNSSFSPTIFLSLSRIFFNISSMSFGKISVSTFVFGYSASAVASSLTSCLLSCSFFNLSKYLTYSFTSSLISLSLGYGPTSCK